MKIYGNHCSSFLGVWRVVWPGFRVLRIMMVAETQVEASSAIDEQY